MNQHFNILEIAKIAVNVEKNGRELYLKLENNASDKQLMSMWKYLKEQEEIHQKFFEALCAKINDYPVQEYGIGDYETYLRAIAHEYIFTEQQIAGKIKEGFQSNLDAIRFGISIEKESIFIYTTLKDFISDDKQHTLDTIIDEEKKHLVCLIQMKESIEEKNS